MKPNTPTIDSINLTLTLDQWETLLTLVGREQCVNEKAAGLALVNDRHREAERYIGAAELLQSIGHALELGGAIAAGVPVTGSSSDAVCGCCDAVPEQQDANEDPTAAACGCNDAAERAYDAAVIAEAAARGAVDCMRQEWLRIFCAHGNVCSPPTNEDDELPAGWRWLRIGKHGRYFDGDALDSMMAALEKRFDQLQATQPIDLVL